MFKHVRNRFLQARRNGLLVEVSGRHGMLLSGFEVVSVGKYTATLTNASMEASGEPPYVVDYRFIRGVDLIG